MPAISLVVCLHKERGLFERLLRKTAECYDDLVVVHDGPEVNNDRTRPPAEASPKKMALAYDKLAFDAPIPPSYKRPPMPPRSGSIHELVSQHGGRYFEGSRCFQQEPHWPFAWSRARHDWILRLDVDEFPSDELEDWLRRFMKEPQPPEDVSGYTCIWPLWNGKRTVTKRWPGGRIFLLHKDRVRFFGMVEQVPIPDSRYESLDLVLHHQPKRKSYGIRNILFRRQAYQWRRVIAESLVGKPTNLPCWRWTAEEWPSPWNFIRCHPLRHSIASLVWFPVCQLKDMLKASEVPNLSACLNPGLHHFMLGLRVFVQKRRHRKRTS